MRQSILRKLLRRPGPSLLIVFTISIGVGISVGLRSISHALLSTAPGVANVESLIRYSLEQGSKRFPFSGPAYDAMGSSGELGNLALWNSSIDVNVREKTAPRSLPGALVNPQFFGVAGISPAFGRFFDSDEDQPGGGRRGWVCVVSYSYWQNAMRGRPDALGSTIVVDGAQVQIVGVLPASFVGMNPPTRVSILLPRHFLEVTSPEEDRFSLSGDMEWQVYGRLAPGDRPDRIQAILRAVEPRVRRAGDPSGYIYPKLAESGSSEPLLVAHLGTVTPSYGVAAIRIPLLMLTGLATALLLLCLCNVVLTLASVGARRRDETAMRLALGATRARLILENVLKTLTLAICGTAMSVPFAYWTTIGLSTVVQSMDGLESFVTVRPDVQYQVFGSLAAVLVTVMSASAVTLWQVGSASLRGQTVMGRQTENRVNSGIVGVELFLAGLLTTIAFTGLLTLQRVTHRVTGYRQEGVVLATASLLGDRADPRSAENELKRVMEAIRASPGVSQVATSSIMPLSGDTAQGSFTMHTGSEESVMWPQTVSLDYLAAVGTPVVRGRSFERADLRGEPVCLLSETAEKELSGSYEAVGRYVYGAENQAGVVSEKMYCRVVGIAGDAHLTSLLQPPERVIYRLGDESDGNVIVRGAADALSSAAVTRAFGAAGIHIVLSRTETLNQRMLASLRLQGLVSRMAAIAALITCFVMAVSLYSVVLLQVSASRREIGVRVALGSTKTGIAKALLRRLSLGLLVGVTAEAAVSVALMDRFLDGYVSNRSIVWSGMAIGVAALVGVVSLAIVQPLRVAFAVSPVECLRSE